MRVAEPFFIKWGPSIITTLALIGFAVAAEHRITVLEESIRNLQENQKTLTIELTNISVSYSHVVTMLAAIQERHKLEDMAKDVPSLGGHNGK